MFFVPFGEYLKHSPMYGKLNILFYPKKLKSDTDGKAMIYVRVTINGKRAEFSLGRRVEEPRWESRGAKPRGSSIEVSNLNRFLDNVKNRLFDIYDDRLKEKLDISAAIVKNIYLGNAGKEYMVLGDF